MKTNLFLAFLLINSVFLQSQSPNDLQKKIITEVATYRATLLEQNIKNSWQLLPNLNKLDTANLEQYQSKVIDIMNASVGIGQRLLFTVNLGEELIKRKANQTSVFDEFSDFEMDIVSKNLDLVDLTRERLLEAQYPFKIVRNARLLQELTFFNVQEKDKVGEIGAAAGTIGILLGLIYDDIHIFLNDISVSSVDYMREKVSRMPQSDSKNNIEVILGEENTPNFEDLQLDKIIIRRAFHHFTEKKAMLTAIKNALKPTGILYIVENIRLIGKQSSNCPEAMTRKQILKSLKKNGFELMEEKMVEGHLLLKFQILEEGY